MSTLRAIVLLLSWHQLAWWRHLGLGLLLLLKGALVWGWPFILAGAVTALTRGPDDGRSMLVLTLGLAGGMLVLNVPMHRWYVWRTSAAVRALEERLRSAALQRLHEASAETLDRMDSGALHTRVVRDVDQAGALAAQWWHHLQLVLLGVVVTVVSTAWSSPELLLGYAVVLPLAALLGGWALHRLERHHGRFRDLLERVGAAVADNLRTLPVARAHGVEADRLDRVRGSLARLRRRGMALDGAASWVDALVWIGFEAVKLGQLALLAHWCWGGRISVGEAVLLHGLFAGLVNSVSGLVWSLPALQSGCASVLALAQMLAPQPSRPLRQLPQPLRGALRLEAVRYRYPGRGEDAVAGIDLGIEPGQHVALAGRSGSGKSTVIQLVLGLRQPQQGRVLLDGADLAEHDLAPWRRRVAVVAQRVVLANASLRENVAFGSPGVDDAAIRRALESVALDGLLARLPAGLDTRLGEDGLALSGGQRQRLSIARAVVRDPLLVVLDEANAALDPATELQVQAALDRLCAGRSVLTVSHRASALRGADLVLVLEQGRVQARGSWAEVRHLIEASHDEGAAA